MYDVIIIGAGTAGLKAAREVKKYTDNFTIVESGPKGTTCARVGCMPSKVLISSAKVFNARHKLGEHGISGADHLDLDPYKVMERTRSLRDYFVSHVINGMEGVPIIEGHAKFVDLNTIQVGDRHLQAKSFVVAVGSTPFVPEAFSSVADKFILTTDTFFEQDRLPESIIVIGLGAIGLEIAQSAEYLGVHTTCMNRSNSLGGITDPVILEQAKQILSTHLTLKFTGESIIKEHEQYIEYNGVRAEKLLIATGRHSNISYLGLEELGLDINCDPTTFRLGESNIYVAGDANNILPLLHEGVDEGQLAGYNAIHSAANKKIKRRVPLGIIFTDPVIVKVGLSHIQAAKQGAIVGEVYFNTQGRSVIEQENKGALRIYISPGTRRILGAEMIGPAAEHIAHLLALAIHKNTTLEELLELPFYHPTIEEGLRSCLKNALSKL